MLKNWKPLTQRFCIHSFSSLFDNRIVGRLPGASEAGPPTPHHIQTINQAYSILLGRTSNLTRFLDVSRSAHLLGTSLKPLNQIKKILHSVPTFGLGFPRKIIWSLLWEDGCADVSQSFLPRKINGCGCPGCRSS